MSTQNDKFEKKLKSLQLAYSRLLPHKVQQVREMWGKVQQEAGSGESLENLRQMAHQLSGSGGAFGYPSVTELAAELELDLVSIAESGEPAGPALVARINEIIDCLNKIVAAGREVSTEPDFADSTEIIPRAVADDRMIYWFSQDPLYAEEHKLQLEYYGYKTRTFTDAKQLFRTMDDQEPLALVLDSVHREGHVFNTRHIVSTLDERAQRVPRIFLCPDGRNLETWLHAVRGGADAFFSKQVYTGTLVNKLDQFLHAPSEKPYRVLAVDDDRVSATQIAHVLSKAGMAVQLVTDPMQVLEVLEVFKPDLILMDLYMPKCSGLELAKIIRNQDAYVSVPIVFLSAEKEDRKHLEAMALGGDDFISKPVRFRYLYHTLAYRIARARTLRGYITHDHLTGLMKHSSIYEKLCREMELVQANGLPLSVAMLDIDHFKQVNNSYGHTTGDQVLKNLARFLTRRLRGGDLVGRFGGEEFLVVMPNTRESNAAALLEKIRSDFARISHFSKYGEFRVTFSGGVLEYDGAGPVESLIQSLEKVLVRGKRAGRNRIQRFSESPNTQVEKEEPSITDSDVQSILPKLGRVVVVDDDPQIARLMVTFLESKYFEVHAAEDGEKGFELVKKIKPDIAVIDLMLYPGIHGFELCKRIKKDRELENTKVIMITGVHKESHYREEAKRRGAEALLEKPVNLGELLNIINGLLAQAAAMEG